MKLNPCELPGSQGGSEIWFVISKKKHSYLYHFLRSCVKNSSSCLITTSNRFLPLWSHLASGFGWAGDSGSWTLDPISTFSDACWDFSLSAQTFINRFIRRLISCVLIINKPGNFCISLNSPHPTPAKFCEFPRQCCLFSRGAFPCL